MSVRSLLVVAGTALTGALVLATPAAAAVSAQSAEVDSYTLTADRLWATAVALLTLAGVVIGGAALRRATRRVGDGGAKGAVVALVAGLIGVIGGVLNLAAADGGPGTGNGVVAGGAAVVLGLVSVCLGWMARSRNGARTT